MPLHWTADSKDRLVITIADGVVTRSDVENHMKTMDAMGTQAYRKLFDGRRGETDMTAEDVLAIGAQLRARHAGGGEHGALALVIPADKADRVSRVLGILATAKRPMRIFSEIEPARRWIESLPK